MSYKSLLATGALALAGLATANAKSYDIILNSPAKAGATQLTPGEYKLKVEGQNAVFTNVQNSKSFTVPAKIETGEKKFNSTAMETTSQGDMDKIQAIELGGSTTKLEFGE